jgi:hypothetical protein
MSPALQNPVLLSFRRAFDGLKIEGHYVEENLRGRLALLPVESPAFTGRDLRLANHWCITVRDLRFDSWAEARNVLVQSGAIASRLPVAS